ncbi:MAG TPA: hypothetical protein VMZ30_05645 [Pyrinomonadaceae bacterium]|nr:hypothetical protein [Pyrinomonadaceae bacterium]
MRTVITLIFACLLFTPTTSAQSVAVESGAKEIIQPSQSLSVALTEGPSIRELTLPGGTPIEVEVAFTVNSLDLRPGEHISFRVLLPVVIDGVAVIEKGALVTARVTQAKRGGHWGKGGKLAWSMEDVVAVDNSRILLAPETSSRNDKLWSLDKKRTASETTMGQGKVKGTSHTGEVAAMMVVSGVLFPPLALLNGFKPGENAVLREGRRFVVAVQKDATVKVAAAVAAH